MNEFGGDIKIRESAYKASRIMHIVPSGLSRFDRRLPVTSGVRVAVDSFIAPDAESDDDVCKENINVP